MSATKKHIPDDDNELFDLLVDNELDEARRRRLLSGLDSRPDGWRKCALAFLEAQSFGAEFSALLSEPIPAARRDDKASDGGTGIETQPAKVAAHNKTTPRRPWSKKNAATLTAMAASFLMAMWIGISIENRDGNPVAGTRPSTFESIPVVNPPVGRMPPVVAASNRGGAVATPALKTEMVNLGSPQFGGGIRVPAVQRDKLDSDWLQSVPPAVPDDVLEALNRTGHEVQQRRELVPMKMKDGRRLVVPVDQVDVHYVGDSAL